METPSRPLKFFKGCFIALPVSLILWALILKLIWLYAG